MGIKERLEGRTTFSSVAGVMKGRTNLFFPDKRNVYFIKNYFFRKGKYRKY